MKRAGMNGGAHLSAKCPMCRKPILTKKDDQGRGGEGEAGRNNNGNGNNENSTNEGEGGVDGGGFLNGVVEDNFEIVEDHQSGGSAAATSAVEGGVNQEGHGGAGVAPVGDTAPAAAAQGAPRTLFTVSTASLPSWFPQFNFSVVERPAAQPAEIEAQADIICEMFPSAERERVKEMLRGGRDANQIVATLLNE